MSFEGTKKQLRAVMRKLGHQPLPVQANEGGCRRCSFRFRLSPLSGTLVVDNYEATLRDIPLCPRRPQGR